ncbi:hypothetical protein ACFTSF_10020 [Kribbella sp. NPDC056951]
MDVSRPPDVDQPITRLDEVLPPTRVELAQLSELVRGVTAEVS